MTNTQTQLVMSEAIKRKQVRIYLDGPSEHHLNRVMDRIRTLSESALVTEMVASLLEACSENGYRIHLPMKIKIVEPDAQGRGAFELNERPTKYGKK
jgi:hypothetical protein